MLAKKPIGVSLSMLSSTSFLLEEFKPFPMMTNRHVMTILGAYWVRQLPITPESGERRLFTVSPTTKVLAHCHFQPANRRLRSPTILAIHGLEGSSNSTYIRGVASKAFAAGMNVVRLNLRNCGGTLDLSPTLYNAGLSADIIEVAKEIAEKDGLKVIFLVGYSIGGNIALKAAAELSTADADWLKGVCAISPPIDLAICIESLENGLNWMYEQYFLSGLKSKIRAKHRFFPEQFETSHLHSIRNIRKFDDIYTGPDGGYGNAENYYKYASALPMLHQIQVPTLIITAKDDPIVPFQTFQSTSLRSQYIHLLAPEHGGHGGFIHRSKQSGAVRFLEDLAQLSKHSLENLTGLMYPDRFWAEDQVIKFCLQVLQDSL